MSFYSPISSETHFHPMEWQAAYTFKFILKASTFHFMGETVPSLSHNQQPELPEIDLINNLSLFFTSHSHQFIIGEVCFSLSKRLPWSRAVWGNDSAWNSFCQQPAWENNCLTGMYSTVIACLRLTFSGIMLFYLVVQDSQSQMAKSKGDQHPAPIKNKFRLTFLAYSCSSGRVGL